MEEWLPVVFSGCTSNPGRQYGLYLRCIRGIVGRSRIIKAFFIFSVDGSIGLTYHRPNTFLAVLGTRRPMRLLICALVALLLSACASGPDTAGLASSPISTI